METYLVYILLGLMNSISLWYNIVFVNCIWSGHMCSCVKEIEEAESFVVIKC